MRIRGLMRLVASVVRFELMDAKRMQQAEEAQDLRQCGEREEIGGISKKRFMLAHSLARASAHSQQ